MLRNREKAQAAFLGGNHAGSVQCYSTETPQKIGTHFARNAEGLQGTFSSVFF